MRRRQFITLLGSATAAWTLAATAQKTTAQRHVEVLVVSQEGGQTAKASLAALRAALSQLGWEERGNIKLEYRWVEADTSLMQQPAKEVVALHPDLLISALSSPATAALLRHTRTIPVLFVNIVDPVGQGSVSSLARPGGNATGFMNLETSMAGKWLELLKQVMPHVTRVAISFNQATAPYAELYLNRFKSSAQSSGVEIITASIPDMVALEAFGGVQAQPNTGFIPVPSAFMIEHQKEIAEIAVRHHLPAISFNRAFAECWRTNELWKRYCRQLSARRGLCNC